MQYNYETKNDLLSITKIDFHVNDNYGGEITIENDGLKYNKTDPLTGHSRPYCSKITNEDLENFKYLFNLEYIEIIINEREMNDKHKELINNISNYFINIGPIETTIYNIFDEVIANFNIGSHANIKFDEKIQQYIFDNYNLIIHDTNEFIAFLRSIKFNHKYLTELYDYRYSKLLDYIGKLEERIKILEEKK